MQHNCPVCNKAGLPDFHIQPIICPQCNSDLKPYMLLHSIGRSHRLRLIVSAGIASLFLGFAFLFYNIVSDNSSMKSVDLQKEAQLNDSANNRLPGIVAKTTEQANVKINSNEIIIHYKVKKGDYPAKIASFFYNDWSMYKKIETDNSLKNRYTLKIGQTLIIKLKPE